MGPFIALVVSILSFSIVRAYQELSDASLRSLPSAADVLDPHTGALLSPILIPRVPGTPGHIAVEHHLAGFFETQLPKWRVDWQNSTSKTPATGDTDIPFKNLILTRDPPWAAPGDVGRLTLAAHYDSLYHVEGKEGFIGATDSAAPCAVLMRVAQTIDSALTAKWEAMEASGDAGMGLEEEKGVQIIFFDGEEAWVTWTGSDSLYGARALAEHWDGEIHPAMSTYRTPLKSISLFLLLDLLGAADPHVPSYFSTTHWAYQGMAKIEERMRRLGLLSSNAKNPFLPESGKQPAHFRGAFVQDDHVPFMVRGVNVLHIIPTPFPDTWHTMNDNAEHLDIVTLDDWSKIIIAFAAEWMELDDFAIHMALATKQGMRTKDEL
ncbi:glutaminyl-peptide cyclotransferase [Xylariaceae sp. FL0016]|nr:glutaminyl-peptide cyclotransferase [Xylariaceae sp. FL0016]